MVNERGNVDYDVLIAGGGMVGASLACSLRDKALRVGVIEAVPFGSASQPSYDDRSIALAYGSRRIFDAMGLWRDLADKVSHIKKIHISNRRFFGFTHLDHRDMGVDALGYVVENRLLGQVLGHALEAQSNVELTTPARLVDFRYEDDAAVAVVEQNGQRRNIGARLLVAADGADSPLRKLLNIEVRRSDYRQTAIIANVTPAGPHHNVAYERFTDTGPLALLPMTENRCSLVWTVGPDRVDELMALDDDRFLEQLQQCFGQRLGRFARIGRRSAYPLALVQARQHVVNRVALIGNAAHTLHPVAGQGFNLGIRDVAALAQVICDAVSRNEDPGSLNVLREYAQWRQQDHRRIITFTDMLARVFANPLRPVAAARNIGLLTIDLVPPVKRMLTRNTMGMAGRLPRLARGLPL
jgi:2-octaprenyl-6-methoxyphenol hydroxylase